MVDLSDDYVGTFEEIIDSIPADTMKVIREGVEDDKHASAFRNVLTVLKRLGFLGGHINDLFEKYPDGIGKGYNRLAVERAYNKIRVPPVLRSYFIEELARKPLKPVEWLVEDFIPANTLTGFFGDGGTGKDRTLLLLAAAVACDKFWLGKKVKHGRALYYNVEDDDDELNRRQAAIAEHYDLNFENFSKRLKIVPLVGKDTVLAVFDSRAGVVKPTPLFESVRQEIAAFKPTLVIIGNRVNIFSVDQNSDAQARQCLGLLFGLCTEFPGTTVIMPGHVSLEGMRSGRGDSELPRRSRPLRARRRSPSSSTASPRRSTSCATLATTAVADSGTFFARLARGRSGISICETSGWRAESAPDRWLMRASIRNVVACTARATYAASSARLRSCCRRCRHGHGSTWRRRSMIGSSPSSWPPRP